MLVLGTANPVGESTLYNGLYFRADELRDMVRSKDLLGVAVKAEHTGASLGSVVSAFLDERGALQCVLEIDDSVEGAIARGLVRDGIAADLSMGYAVDVQNSETGLTAGKKRTLEVSLVRKGAREGCHIQAFQEPGGPLAVKRRAEPPAAPPDAGAWADFDLS